MDISLKLFCSPGILDLHGAKFKYDVPPFAPMSAMLRRGRSLGALRSCRSSVRSALGNELRGTETLIALAVTVVFPGFIYISFQYSASSFSHGLSLGLRGQICIAAQTIYIGNSQLYMST